jgi:neutrophil factor 2
MSILPDDTYDHLVNLLRQKFPELHGKRGVSVSFRDEDGDMLSMQDDGDFEAAVDVPR